MTIDATFWVTISFFIFVGILIYFKIPQKVKGILENNILNIKNQISEAEKLGYEVFVTSRFKKEITRKKDIKILEVEKIESLITNLFK